MRLSIVIPVYRSQESLRDLHKKITQAADGLDDSYELLLVEDCGGDNSWQIIQEICAEDSHVRGVRLTRNFGQHYALSAGLESSRGDWVVTMDCDLQDDPKFIPQLMSRALDGAEIVLVRRVGRDDGWLNQQSSRVFYWLFDLLTGARTDPAVGSYRIMSRRVVDTFCRMPERYRFYGGMIQWMGFSTVTLDVPRQARHSGRSSYNLLRRLALASDAVLSFTDRPLKLMVLFGALTTGVSLAYAAVIVIQRLTGRIAEIGFASLLVSLYLLGGMIVMSIGLVGVYVGRIYTEVKGRPIYLIAETTDD
ncbi:MAG: glycosyltransferase family 2 protein [Planctomycetaceae bacterium]|nr:glycosyltransferase family 2 protein [Planctomycetaceae bacterium]